MSYDPLKRMQEDERAPWLRDEPTVARPADPPAGTARQAPVKKNDAPKSGNYSWITVLGVLAAIIGAVLRATLNKAPAPPPPPTFTVPSSPPVYNPTSPNSQPRGLKPNFQPLPRNAEEVRQRMLQRQNPPGVQPPVGPEPYTPVVPPSPGPFSPPPPPGRR